MKILVTGRAGFIGGAVARSIINQTKYDLVNLDKLTYAGNLDSLPNIASLQSYTHKQADFCDRQVLDRVFRQHKPDCVLHLAAESHVDRLKMVATLERLY